MRILVAFKFCGYSWEYKTFWSSSKQFFSKIAVFHYDAVGLASVKCVLFLHSLGWQEISLRAPTHNMVKHTQTILRQQPTNYLSVFDHFVKLTLKRLNGTHLRVSVFFCKICPSPNVFGFRIFVYHDIKKLNFKVSRC